MLMPSRLADHPLVAYPKFRVFFTGRMLSSIGDKFFTITLAWYVVSQGQENSKLHLGILMALNVLPLVLLGSTMGTLVDRFSRRNCMQVANFVRFSLIGVLCALFFTGLLNLTVLYVLVFIISAVVPLFEASAQASLKDLSDEDSVSQTVALNSTSVYLSNILGAMLGGILIAAIGTGWALGINACCYLASFFFITALRIPGVVKGTREKFSSQMKEGFRFLKRQKPMLYMLLVFAALNLFAAPLTLLIPMIVKFELHETSKWLALLDGSFALGAGVTAIILSFRRKHQWVYQKIFVALAAMGLTMCAVALTPVKYFLIAEFMIIGAGLAITNALAVSLFQHYVPDEIKGRFFALQVSVATAVIPLAYLINGLLTQSLEVQTVMLINGIATAVSAFFLLFVPRISNKI